jgi:hypothetical protein
MQIVLMAVLVLHVLAAVFWAGSTFTLARMAGERTEQFFAPQMGAAAVAALTGLVLWRQLHSGTFGLAEQILAAGVAAARRACRARSSGERDAKSARLAMPTPPPCADEWRSAIGLRQVCSPSRSSP